MTYYHTNWVFDQLARASKEDPQAAASLAAMDVPWASTPGYADMILVQPKLAATYPDGRIRILNQPPAAGERSQQCADVYQRGRAGISCEVIPLPASFQVRGVKYADGRFTFVSRDGRSLRGTVAQIKQAMAEVRFALEGVSESQFEECFARIPTTDVPTRLRVKTAAENPSFTVEHVGTFTFDEPTQSFIASHPTGGRSIDISVHSRDGAEAMAMLPTIRSVVDGEDALSADQFSLRLSLKSVSIDAGGELTIHYTDGELFFGHEVAVSVNSKDEMERADIEG